MKILIVTHYFKPHIGGIEIVAYNQAKELGRKSHKVTIVTSQIGDEPIKEITNGVVIKRVRAWNFLENRFRIPYPIPSPILISIFLKEIKKADIIHIHDVFY